MIQARAIRLSSSLPPTEFRLFTKGWNETENGRFLFDDAAAKSVMASYKKWGIDLPIDLEHQMLDLEGGEADPTARDARGWCKLELRPDGSLWAVNVTWTPDGAQRLQQKRQRYISPAFEVDPKTKRVSKILNVAITALPATHNTPSLVAAAARGIIIMKTAFDPSTNSPADAHKLLVQVATLLGVDDPDSADHDTIDQALDSLFAVITGDTSGGNSDGATAAESAQTPRVVGNDANPGKDGLTDSQRKACRAIGCSATDFLRAKAVIGGFRG